MFIQWLNGDFSVYGNSLLSFYRGKITHNDFPNERFYFIVAISVVVHESVRIRLKMNWI